MSKTKISAKDREDAELLCLLRANVGRRFGAAAVIEAHQSIGASEDVRWLASMAWMECIIVLGGAPGCAPGCVLAGIEIDDIELEAAALIRDGWCPGDPVVRLR